MVSMTHALVRYAQQKRKNEEICLFSMFVFFVFFVSFILR